MLSFDVLLLWIVDIGNGCLCMLCLGGGELSMLELLCCLYGLVGLVFGGGVVWIVEIDVYVVLCFDLVSGVLSDVLISE